MVTVLMIHLLNEAMGSQEAELAADPGRTAPFLRPGVRRRGEAKGLQILVAKAVEEKLPATHGFEQRDVGLLEGTQSAHPLSLPSGGPPQGPGQFLQSGAVVHAGQ